MLHTLTRLQTMQMNIALNGAFISSKFQRVKTLPWAAAAAVLSASICSCFLQTELLSSSWYSRSFSFSWLSSLKATLSPWHSRKQRGWKNPVNPRTSAISTFLKVQRVIKQYLKGTPKSPAAGCSGSDWGGSWRQGRHRWGSWGSVRSPEWAFSAGHLLAPPAGRGQQQLVCQG